MLSNLLVAIIKNCPEQSDYEITRKIDNFAIKYSLIISLAKPPD